MTRGEPQTSTNTSAADRNGGVGLSGQLLIAVGRPVLTAEKYLPELLRRSFGARILLLAGISLAIGPAVSVLLFDDVLRAALFIAAVVATTGFLGYCEMYTAIIAFSREVERVQGGEFDVEFDWERPDELGRAFAGFQAMAGSLEENISEAEEAREVAESERQRISELLDGLEATADRYNEQMERAAAGDLTVRLDPDEDSEAMASIAESFNGTIAELEATVADIRQFAGEVVEASEAVTDGAGEVRSASEQVSGSVREISAGADQQTEQLRTVTEEMENLSGTIEDVASSADEVAATARKATELGRQSRAAATEAIEEMDAIERRTETAVGDVESFAEEVAEIGEITDMIAEIADQTNQLALNASIEAARAGEGGEEFAVVADEVKRLAAEAVDATDRIEAMVEDIRSSATETVGEIRDMGDQVENGAATVETALADLEAIVEEVEDASRGIQEISDATEDQAASTEEVAGMVKEVMTVARRTSGKAEDVSAAAQQQTASLTDVGRSADSLSERAVRLRERLDQFDLDTSESLPDPAGDPGGQVAVDGGRADPT